MSEPKLTPWFPPDVKPVRRGWYLRDYLSGPAYSHWNGARWSGGCLNLIDRAFVKHHPSHDQSMQWRGLAEKPQ